MSTIDATTAENITRDYFKNGNQTHFKFGGKTIKGYLFTRKELTDLFENNSNNEIFMMLALSGTNPNKYLNIVLAKMHDNTMNTGTMIVSSDPPCVDNVIYSAKGLSIKSSDRKHPDKNKESALGQPILVEELKRIQDAFENATDGHLTCTTTDRIKCYRLDRQDLNDLTLDKPGNQDDKFIFMPVIRPKRATDPTPLTKDYLSLAVARFDPVNKKVSGAIIEYCLPCPSTCATNYWHG